MNTYKNSTFALVDGLSKAFSEGKDIFVRTSNVKEIRSHTIRILHPLERVYVLPNRSNNIFAMIAETLWVMAGRNDITFLSRYLPRAIDYSDDGITWRAGYGQRLRNWNGIDQFEQVAKILLEDPGSRRAVMSIFDPASDFVNSKDIPCNNWLHFLIRDGLLHLNLAVRSNDILWGFSGINTFEWSVLHEMMAFWTNSKVGEFSVFIGSFHLYEKHFERGKEIISHFPNKTLYDFGIVGERFSTKHSDFNDVMNVLFDMESRMRTDTINFSDIDIIEDRFIKNCAQLLFIYNAYLNKKSIDEIVEHINALPNNDFRVGVVEFFSRKDNTNNTIVINQQERMFFDVFHRSSVDLDTSIDVPAVYEILKTLHYKKSLSYKDSWKKHGEIASIFANISRKYDRMKTIKTENAQATADESIVDTIADLAVYAAKYLTFLAGKYPHDFEIFLSNFKEHQKVNEYSSTIEGFELMTKLLIQQATLDKQKFSSVEQCFLEIEKNYSQIEHLLITDENKATEHSSKCSLASNISLASTYYLVLLASQDNLNFKKFKNYVDSL